METYTGTWKSTKYGMTFSRGNATVDLYPKTHNEDYEVEVNMLYLGIFRLRQNEKFKVLISKFDENKEDTLIVTSDGEFETPPEIFNGDPTPTGKGVLTFEIKSWDDNNVVKGVYKLSHPADEGNFTLKKGTSNGKTCLVM